MNIVKFLLHRVVLLAVVVFGMVACSGSDPAPPNSNVTLAEIQTQLNVLNGLFATSPPAATDPTLAALVAPGFMDDGMNKDAFLIGITDPTFYIRGLALTAQASVAPPRDSGVVANDATHQWFTLTCSICGGEIHTWLAIKEVTAGKWQVAGNQRKVGVIADLSAFRSTFNGTVNMSSNANFSLSQVAAELLALGVNSVTVSGPGVVNSIGNAGPATLFDGTQTSFMSVNECNTLASITTNCFNYANLAAGDYIFTVNGNLNNVPFTHTYVETLSVIPPATANLTAAMFPVISSVPSLASLVPNATLTVSWTLPSGYTPGFSFMSATSNLGDLFNVNSIESVVGSSVTSTFTLPPVFANADPATSNFLCVSALSVNGVSFYTCGGDVGISPPLPTPIGSTAILSMPFNGSVVSNLNSSYTYTTVGDVGVINLTDMSDDVDVSVYTDASFTLPSSNWVCTFKIGTVADSCTAITPVPSGSVLYIRAETLSVNGSATFMLNVAAPTPGQSIFGALIMYTGMGNPSVCGLTPDILNVVLEYGYIFVAADGSFNDGFVSGQVNANGNVNITMAGDIALGGTCPAGSGSGTMSNVNPWTIPFTQGGDVGTITLIRM